MEGMKLVTPVEAPGDGAGPGEPGGTRHANGLRSGHLRRKMEHIDAAVPTRPRASISLPGNRVRYPVGEKSHSGDNTFLCGRRQLRNVPEQQVD